MTTSVNNKQPVDIIVAVKEKLQQKGTLQKVRSLLRDEIYRSFIDVDKKEDNIELKHDTGLEEKSPVISEVKKQPLINSIINHLIIEYLEFNGFFYSSSTIKSELSKTCYRMEDTVQDNCGGFLKYMDISFHPKYEQVRREMLKNDLGLKGHECHLSCPESLSISKFPLIYEVIERMLERKEAG